MKDAIIGIIMGIVVVLITYEELTEEIRKLRKETEDEDNSQI